MLLNKLKLTNFRRYKDFEFSFTNGLNIIVGENGAGKSTIFHAVLYAFYGQAALPFPVSSIPFYGTDDCRVELTGTSAKGKFRIERTTKSAKVVYDGNEVTGIVAVNNFVEEHLTGVDYSLFKLVGTVGQGEIEFFSNMRPSERKSYISKIYDIHKVKEAVKYLKERLKETKIELSTLESTIETIKVERSLKDMVTERDELEGDIEEYAEWLNELKAEFENALILKRKMDRASTLLENIPKDVFKKLKKVSDVDSLESEYTKLKSFEKAFTEYKMLKEQLDSLEEVEDSYEELEGMLDTFSEQLGALKDAESVPKRAKVEPMSDEDKDFCAEWGIKSGVVYQVECPACHSRTSPVCQVCGLDMGRASDLSRHLSRLAEWEESENARKVIESLPSEKELKERIAIVKEAIDSKKEWDRLEARLKKLGEVSIDIDSGRLSELESIIPYISSYKSYVKASDAVKGAKEIDLEGLTGKIDAVELKLSEARQEMAALKSEIEHAERLKTIKNKVKQLKKDKKYLSKASKKMAEFELVLRSKIIPLIESTASNIFNSVFPGRYDKFELDKNFNIKLDGNLISHHASGGEKHLANLSLRLGVTNFLKVVRGAKFNFLMLDEVSSALDSGRVESAVQQLKLLTNIYPQVFLISHNQLEMEYADNVIALTL